MIRNTFRAEANNQIYGCCSIMVFCKDERKVWWDLKLIVLGNGSLSLLICSFHCKLMIVVLFPPRNGQIWGRKQVYKLGKVVICPQYRPLMRSFQEGEEECLWIERISRQRNQSKKRWPTASRRQEKYLRKYLRYDI